MDLENTQTVAEAASGPGGRPAADGPAGVVLGPRDTLSGKLSIEGDLRIQGTVDGEVKATGDVQIEQGATVAAGVEGRNVSVQGAVTGKVTAKRRLALTGPGSITGDVRVAKLSIDDGATLNGNVTMGSSPDRSG